MHLFLSGQLSTRPTDIPQFNVKNQSISIDKYLSSGLTANVFRTSNSSYILKQFKKNRKAKSMFDHEYKIMQTIQERLKGSSSLKFFPSVVHKYEQNDYMMLLIKPYAPRLEIKTSLMIDECIKCLDALHDIKIVHGDICPRHIRTYDDHVLLIDFGFSRDSRINEQPDTYSGKLSLYY